MALSASSPPQVSLNSMDSSTRSQLSMLLSFVLNRCFGRRQIPHYMIRQTGDAFCPGQTTCAALIWDSLKVLVWIVKDLKMLQRSLTSNKKQCHLPCVPLVPQCPLGHLVLDCPKIHRGQPSHVTPLRVFLTSLCLCSLTDPVAGTSLQRFRSPWQSPLESMHF